VLDEDVAPDPQLMESMRAVGYTLETAVADIIDNSITAGSDRVDVRFTAAPEPRIAIIDNGSGMNHETLLQGMRLAGRPPSVQRRAYDLGRFGLGLKTASLSQARSLTVATKQGTELLAVRWDLDHLKATGKWSLQVLDDVEARSLRWIESLEASHSGTLVLWEKLDQLRTNPEQFESQLDELMIRVRDHLSLVFHRFTGTTVPPLDKPLVLRINGATVPQVDPFLTNNRGTQRGQVETIRIEGSQITVQPYTLPYINKLNAADRRAALVAGTLRDSQGFYIYRAGRLVLWGTWFRIMPRDELGKLARVQVDMPNTLDHLWALDIKKSAASPPPEVIKRLKRIADKIVGPSRRVHTFRGRRLETRDVARFWNVIEDRDTFRYEINRDHPVIVALSESLESPDRTVLTHVLTAIEATFPIEDAYNRLGTDNSHTPLLIEKERLVELARMFQSSLGVDAPVLAQRLALIEPFSGISDLESFLKEALDD
jgi:Histidine kinase-, DNA gyrase B-, and HSP90-like ATPase